MSLNITIKTVDNKEISISRYMMRELPFVFNAHKVSQNNEISIPLSFKTIKGILDEIPNIKPRTLDRILIELFPSR